jgi:hypothetical protein
MTENKDLIIKEIGKLRPINYNKFRWWRRFEPISKPLPPASPLLSKIRNGDLEFSNYWWQAKFTEIEIDEKRNESDDIVHWVELTQLDRARKKRLWDDFERDEGEKLTQLKKGFVREFHITEEDYEEEINKFGGTIEELYIYIKDRYGKRIIPLERRGRKPKSKL